MSYDVNSGRYDSGSVFRGALMTQEMSRGLFDKRRFRAYREFTANTTIKMVFTTPFLLTHQKLWSGQGAARGVISTGGTESGTFVALPSKFCLNTKGGDSTGLSTFTVGGSVTLGVEREVLRCDSGTAGGGSGNSDLLDSPRVLGAGTYYFSIVVTGATQGMWTLEWEELPEYV